MNAWWEDLDIRAIIKKILSSGADINMTNNSGETPLHRLVTNLIPTSERYLDIVSEFLKYKPNVTSPMRNGLSILAVFLDNSDILSKDNRCAGSQVDAGFRCLEQFLDAGVDPNIMCHSKPLLDYCLENGIIREHGPSEKFIKLLLQKADIGFARPHGNPLHLALARRNVYTPWTSGWTFPSYAITAALIALKVNVNQTNAAGASPLEFWLDNNECRSSDRMKVALLLVKAGAVTTILTSTGRSLFDYLPSGSRSDRICLAKAFLEADINSQQDDVDISASLEWAGIWRSTWKQPFWHLAKAGLTELGQIYPRPKIKEFHECAFAIIAEHLLERHRSQLELWRTGDVSKESVKEDYEEYCAILRDCRERQAEVRASWYTYLLDLLDYS